MTSTELPLPNGPGGAHWSNNNSSVYPQLSDAFVLRFDLNDPFTLDYGTLFGGTRDDVFLDVNSDHLGNVYITGETRSYSGFNGQLDPDLYYRAPNNYVDRRDAVIVGMKDDAYPVEFWRTAFGGEMSDRGWGIAASATEVYMCGATASNAGMLTEDFPLHEFNTSSNEDYYQEWNLWGDLGGLSEFVPYQAFYYLMDHESEGTPESSPEGTDLQYDGFMASFLMEGQVGVPHVTNYPSSQLVAWPIDEFGSWMLRAPEAANWSLQVYDAAGKLAHQQRFNGLNTILNLAHLNSGIYIVRASDGSERTLHTKLCKP